MNYRRWPRKWKIAYWLTIAGLVATSCFVVTIKGRHRHWPHGPLRIRIASALSDTNSGWGPPTTDATTAPGESTPERTTATTEAEAPLAAAGPSGGPSSSVPSVPATTLVATLNGNVPGSPSPDAAPTQVVPGSWHGYPSILPVIATEQNRIDVRLAQRPNESSAWIPRSDAVLSKDHFAIEVNLATMQLSVFKRGRQVKEFPAGIGRPTSPTPVGNFFVTMTVPPPSPGYGPFVLVTSAHSETITDWDNSGDAIIAIHGPIDTADDALIGTTGAAVSNGCVRLHDADLAQLSSDPAGHARRYRLQLIVRGSVHDLAALWAALGSPSPSFEEHPDTLTGRSSETKELSLCESVYTESTSIAGCISIGQSSAPRTRSCRCAMRHPSESRTTVSW